MQPHPTNPFPSASKTDWVLRVRNELKDEKAEESLRWQPDASRGAESFVLEPYYTADDISRLPLTTIQAAQKQTIGWLNAPDYELTADPKADNGTIRDALVRGADALILTVSGPSVDHRFLSRLLDGIKLSDTPVFFRTTQQVDTLLTALQAIAPYQLKGGLLMAARATMSDDDLNTLVDQIHRTADSPQFYTVCIDSHAFHNAGATITQELAFTLGQLADLYDLLTDKNVPIEQLITKTIVSVSVGTSYFPEIAKFRALRVLVARFLSHYSVQTYRFPFVHAQTSLFYDAAATPYTNQLRATTEAMAAVIGGCDALTIHPYDRVFGKTSEFSERIARNVSVLLKEESYFDKVADPAAGSYYIENLTHQLTEGAWALFLRLEELGGFRQAYGQGFVQTEIDRAYQAKVDAVRNGQVLVGVTKFRHDDEQTLLTERLKRDNSDFLPDRRLAEVFE